MINAWWQGLTFTIQEGVAVNWRRVVDTSMDSPDDIAVTQVASRASQ